MQYCTEKGKIWGAYRFLVYCHCFTVFCVLITTVTFDLPLRRFDIDRTLSLVDWSEWCRALREFGARQKWQYGLLMINSIESRGKTKRGVYCGWCPSHITVVAYRDYQDSLSSWDTFNPSDESNLLFFALSPLHQLFQAEFHFLLLLWDKMVLPIHAVASLIKSRSL